MASSMPMTRVSSSPSKLHSVPSIPYSPKHGVFQNPESHFSFSASDSGVTGVIGVELFFASRSSSSGRCSRPSLHGNSVARRRCCRERYISGRIGLRRGPAAEQERLGAGWHEVQHLAICQFNRCVNELLRQYYASSSHICPPRLGPKYVSTINQRFSQLSPHLVFINSLRLLTIDKITAQDTCLNLCSISAILD